jgi:phosphonate transport system substrate-binding protein
MEYSIRRRTFVGAGFAAFIASRAAAQPVFRLGLTPVFLDNDAAVIDGLRRALSRGMGREIELVQRRTYQEITGLLLERSVDAAWLCGYPYLQHADLLDLVAVPQWRGSPRYQSYLIVGAEDGAEALSDLRGGTHAFSDPDSNSGYLVTATDLRRMGEQVDGFFSRSIFTFGQVRSGSVDGYVWEALAVIEPGLTARTRVIARSEWLGFPPVCARRDSLASEPVQALQTALMNLAETEEGQQALASLQLDGFQQATPALFDGIADRMADLDP